MQCTLSYEDRQTYLIIGVVILLTSVFAWAGPSGSLDSRGNWYSVLRWYAFQGSDVRMKCVRFIAPFSALVCFLQAACFHFGKT